MRGWCPLLIILSIVDHNSSSQFMRVFWITTVKSEVSRVVISFKFGTNILLLQ